jgi:hypothetical protein
VTDPHDLGGVTEALGRAGRERAVRELLGDRHLVQYAALSARLVAQAR